MFKCNVNPEYFLDEMSSDEVGYLSDSYITSHREKWEMLRSQNHAVLSSQSTKSLKLTDVMKFDWDEDKVEARSPEDAKKERDRIIKRYNL